MGGTFKVQFYVWPHSGVQRGDSILSPLRANAGKEKPICQIEAENFSEAHRKAELILEGIKCDERVWECGIEAIVLVR